MFIMAAPFNSIEIWIVHNFIHIFHKIQPGTGDCVTVLFKSTNV